MTRSTWILAPTRILDLFRRGLLNDGEYIRAIEWATRPPSRAAWAEHLRTWLLVFGLMLLVSGVILFGAFNWQALGRGQKLGLVLALLLGTWLAARIRGERTLEGGWLLTTSSLLVGAWLAVFGQIYQTGADAYTLFAIWGALLIPWALCAHRTALWTFHGAILQTAFVLFWEQRIEADFSVFCLVNGFWCGLWALLWQWAPRPLGAHPRGLVNLWLAAGLFPLTAAGALGFFEPKEYGACLAFTLLALLGTKARWGRQVSTMTLVCLCLLVLTGAFLARLFGDLEIYGYLLTTLGLVAMVARCTTWLRGFPAAEEALSPREQTAAPSSPSQAPSDVWSELARHDLLDHDGPRAPEEASPLYLGCLSIAGAWLASLFFLFFLFALIYHNSSAMMLTGVVLLGGSFWGRTAVLVPSEFRAQICLVAQVVGQLAVLLGLAEQPDPLERLVYVAFLLQVLALLLYPDRFGRALFALTSSLSGACSVHQLMGWDAVPLWFWGQGAVLTWLFLNQRGWLLSRWRDWYGPVGIGWSLSFLLSTSLWFSYWVGLPHPGLLSLGLLILNLVVAVRLQAPMSALVLLLGLGLLTWSTPSLLAATLLFALAFHLHWPSLAGMAVLAMMVSGSVYYYNLELDFLSKSAALVGSGLLCLTARRGVQGVPREPHL